VGSEICIIDSNWVFVADQLDYEWTEVIQNESLVGRNLVWYDSISSWKSLAPGSYNWDKGTWNTFDGTSWVSASEELISYSMDPRNFLDEKTIFMFELLSFDAGIHKEENVESLLTGTFMGNAKAETGKTYARTFMEAAAQSGVSPYHLASRVIQEVGTSGTTGGVTGNYRPATGNVYTGFYNFYNIGAYAHDGRGAVENGLIYASKTDPETLRPWNTKYKAIVGGAVFIGSGYINIGQDTLYYEKFDLIGTPYTHQYMANVQAPKSEAVKMSNAYSDTMKKTIPLVFKIPVYKNMPAAACECPTGDGSPNNVLDNIVVEGYSLTPTFSKFTTQYDLIVSHTVESIKISASAMDGKAVISGTGKKVLQVGSNLFEIRVTANNGAVRTYTLMVVRKAANDNGNEPATGIPEEPTTGSGTVGTAEYSTSYNVQDDIYITGIQPDTAVSDFKSGFTLKGCTMEIYQADGKTPLTGSVGTGSRILIRDMNGTGVKEYACIVYGDINGDGQVDIVDMLYMKRHILGTSSLNGLREIAADVNKKGGIDIVDMLYMKRHMLGRSYISQ
ncbi:MAG: cadherin-like beta sandwich domain-containing protein, partial [Lachnospiraceae bacterium]|nr:cadherin-like beta sandwich domain-containing protein [Lachnospiraceae bacterium]